MDHKERGELIRCKIRDLECLVLTSSPARVEVLARHFKVRLINQGLVKDARMTERGPREPWAVAELICREKESGSWPHERCDRFR